MTILLDCFISCSRLCLLVVVSFLCFRKHSWMFSAPNTIFYLVTHLHWKNMKRNIFASVVFYTCLINVFRIGLCSELGGPLIRKLADRVIILQQSGRIRGVLVEFPENQHDLQPVERYTGMQYGSIRGAMGSMLHFMPPSSAFMPIWGDKTKEFTTFSPVCPQDNNRFYGDLLVRNGHSELFKEINAKPENQDEDCLYLNMWCPLSCKTSRIYSCYSVCIRRIVMMYNDGIFVISKLILLNK